MTELPEPPEYVEPYSYDDNPPSLKFERGEMKPVYGPDITDSGIIAQVRRSYRDTKPNESVTTEGSRHLSFVSDWLNPSDMQTLWAVGYIGQYNQFDPEVSQWFVSSLDSDKNRVAIGREGSPVLYIWTTEPKTVVEYLDQMRDISSNVSWGGGTNPDELSLEIGAKIYPHSARYGAPDSQVGEFVWIDQTPPSDINWEDIQDPTLVRAWWD